MGGGGGGYEDTTIICVCLPWNFLLKIVYLNLEENFLNLPSNKVISTGKNLCLEKHAAEGL